MGQRIWFPNDQAELLAWLDFCRENELDFEESVEGHLRARTGKEYTMSQIKQRIIRWCRGSPSDIFERPDSSPFKIVQEEGSACLADLEEETRESIKKKLLQYRKMFSQLIMPKKQSIADSNDETNKELSPSRHRHIRNSSSSVNDRQETRSDAAQQDKVQSNSKPSQPSSAASVSALPLGLVGNTEKGSRALVASNVDGQRRQPAVLNAGSMQERGRKDTSAPERCNERIQKKDAEIRDIQALWQDEVYGLYKKEEALKRKIAELEAQNEHMIIARQERERAGKDPLEELLYLKTHENWRLTQWIHNAERISKFARLDSIGPNSFERDDIERFIKRMQSELESILCGHELDSRLLLPRLEGNSDLGSLVRCVFGSENDAHNRKQLRVCLSRCTPQMTIRALFLAALKVWVFGIDFPNFNPTENRCLNAYREVILAVGRCQHPYPPFPSALLRQSGGWRQLKSLDLAAYRLLSETEWFKKDRVPFRSAALSIRLSKALAPFFVADRHDSETNFETWGEEPAIWKLRQESFSRLFEIALSFKTSTVKSDQQFEFVVYRPGNCVGGSIASSPVQHQNRGDETLQAEFWKIASIHVYKGESSQPRDTLADALIQPRNFCSKTAKDRFEKSLFSKDILLPKTLDKMAEGRLRAGNQDSNSSLLRSAHEGISSQSASMAMTTIGVGPSPEAPITIEQTVLQQEDLSRGGKGNENENGTHSPNPASLMPLGSDMRSVVTEAASSSTMENQCQANTAVPSQSKKRSRDGDEVSRPLVCDRCGRSFVNSAKLHEHQKNKTCSRCSECGKMFTTKADLKEHEDMEHGSEYSLHHNGKRVRNSSKKCAICSKRFANMRDLKAHLRNESCSRCTECQIGFESLLELENHRRSEHGTRPLTSGVVSGQTQCQDASSKTRYTCEVCKTNFTELRAQKNHHKIQHVNPVDCPRCHKEFIGRALLKKHTEEDYCEVTVTNAENETDEESCTGDGLDSSRVQEITDTTMEDAPNEDTYSENEEQTPSLVQTTESPTNGGQHQLNGMSATGLIENTESRPWTRRNSGSWTATGGPDFDTQESEERPLLRAPASFGAPWPPLNGSPIVALNSYLQHSSY